ncbi:MAG: CHAT domain-containing protein [Woeseiaceae bacterium]
MAALRLVAAFGLLGANALAAEKTAALTESAPIELTDIEQVSQTTLELTSGTWLVEIEQSMATAEVSIQPLNAQAPLTTLRGVSGGIRIPWVISINKPSQFSVTTRFAEHTTPSAKLRLTLRELNDDNQSLLNALKLLQKIFEIDNDNSDERNRSILVAAKIALAAWEPQNDAARQAELLLIIAEQETELGNYTAAQRVSVDAFAAARRSGSALLQGNALTMAGLSAHRIGEDPIATEQLEQAESMLAPFYDGIAVNPATSNLCFQAMNLRRFEDAEECYKALLPLARQSGNLASLRLVQNNLGGIFAMRDQPLDAIRFLKQGLTTAERMEDDFLRARSLNNIATQYRRISRMQDALNAYQTALELFRKTGNVRAEARALGNIGVAYGALNEPQQAVDFLQRAHDMKIEFDQLRLLNAKVNLAGALVEIGKFKDAFELYKEALKMARARGAPEELIANIRIDQAIARLKRGETDLGIRSLEEIVSQRTPNGRSANKMARAFYHLGLARDASGAFDAASKALNESLKLRQDMSDPLGIAETVAALGWLELKKNDFDAAGSYANTAIEQIETLRTDIANTELRASYQATIADAYELAIYALMAETTEANTKDALAMVERYRAQTLVDVLSANTSGISESVPQSLRDDHEALLARISLAENNRLRGRPSENLSEVTAALNVLDAKISELDPRYKATARKQSLQPDQLQDLIGPKDIALQFFLGRSDSYLWTISNQDINAYRLPSSAGIEALTRQLHTSLAERGNYRSVALALGNALLAPVTEQLGDFQNIIIVADGALHYLPFEVLRTSAEIQPLAAKRSVSYLPSLTTLALTRGSRSSGAGNASIAVLADPVFDVNDERISKSLAKTVSMSERGTPLSRLRMSGAEARAIEALAGDRKTQVHLGVDANTDALQSPQLRAAQIVHIASHGFVNDDVPARTGLALSMVNAAGAPTTGFVGLRDIYELDLEAELVVLSACDTALGRDIAGEGLLGLTRGFMYAGADRVIASLWQVEDRATATLMEYFYEGMLKNALAPSVALAKAKQRMQTSRRWRHPYYWSGFVLSGDWNKLTDR